MNLIAHQKPSHRNLFYLVFKSS